MEDKEREAHEMALQSYDPEWEWEIDRYLIGFDQQVIDRMRRAVREAYICGFERGWLRDLES